MTRQSHNCDKPFLLMHAAAVQVYSRGIDEKFNATARTSFIVFESFN
jgi:hypothetical protein